MSPLILPERAWKKPDPYIAPISGKRGPCNLCGHYSDLTEAHILPQSAGNRGQRIAQSYLIASTANKDLFRGRNFPNGIRFRTLCADCNNRLGANEDKAIGRFYRDVERFITAPVAIPWYTKIPTQPNKLIKGILAHLVSANDAGLGSGFDHEARNAYFGKVDLQRLRFNVFYWIYLGSAQFIIRDAFLAHFGPGPLNMVWAHVLKLFPLAFAVMDTPRFYGLPNLRQFITTHDDEEAEIPVLFGRYESNPVWPIHPDDNTGRLVFLGGAGSSGIIAGPA